MKTYLSYGAVLIAAYLLVRNATGAGRLISESAYGTTSVIKAFQGR